MLTSPYNNVTLNPLRLNVLSQEQICSETFGDYTNTYLGYNFPHRCGPYSRTHHRNASAEGYNKHDSDKGTHLPCTPSHSQSVSKGSINLLCSIMKFHWKIRGFKFGWFVFRETSTVCSGRRGDCESNRQTALTSSEPSRQLSCPSHLRLAETQPPLAHTYSLAEHVGRTAEVY